MKTCNKTVILILLLSSLSLSQNFKFVTGIGNFKSATSFYITSAGTIYVTDAGTNEIYKIDTLGNVLKYAGGYGWDDGQFDTPIDVYANPLSVFVCDKNNNRIERFDKDLNFVSSLYTRDNSNRNERFGYPLSCALSQQGDLYILDSENKRVVKFDLFGNFTQNFGGYDAGSFSLSKPIQLAVSADNKIFVLDKNRIVVFDQYGNNVALIKNDNELDGIRIIFDNLTLTNHDTVYYTKTNNVDFEIKKAVLTGTGNLTDIINSLIFNNKLYVLTPEKILIFKAE